MVTIEVARTVSGRAIAIPSEPMQIKRMDAIFATFLERDLFDALLGVDYLILCATRKAANDWLDVLTGTRAYLSDRLPKHSVVSWCLRLGMRTAFAARDYGRALIHPHFRSL